jgi:hypothetical protein
LLHILVEDPLRLAVDFGFLKNVPAKPLEDSLLERVGSVASGDQLLVEETRHQAAGHTVKILILGQHPQLDIVPDSA